MENKVFQPIYLHGLTLANRLVRSATWEGVATEKGGIMEEAYPIYEELAKGGVGLIITGFTSVADNDHYFEAMMRLSRDELIPQYKRLVDIIHRKGVPVMPQLALGAYYKGHRQIEPTEMTVEEIQAVVGKFTEAAVRAEKAGFDGVQIHVAHFFFLSRFVSPAANRRTDEYGGSTRGRMRIVTEIIEGIRKAAPKLHISIKMNCNDFMPGGITESTALEMGDILAEAGIDSIEVSGNGTSVRGIQAHIDEAYFLGTAAKMAERINVPVMLVGGLRSLDTMDRILSDTKIKLLSLSRPLIREPDLPEKFRTGRADVARCISCNACYSTKYHLCVFRRQDMRKEGKI